MRKNMHICHSVSYHPLLMLMGLQTGNNRYQICLAAAN